MSNNPKYTLEKMADVFKALSNPNRLEIFRRLITCCRPGTISTLDSCSGAYVGELGKDLNIVPSTVSHHIKELRRAGLIRTRRDGQKIECWIDPEIIEIMKEFFTV